MTATEERLQRKEKVRELVEQFRKKSRAQRALPGDAKERREHPRSEGLILEMSRISDELTAMSQSHFYDLVRDLWHWHEVSERTESVYENVAKSARSEARSYAYAITQFVREWA